MNFIIGPLLSIIAGIVVAIISIRYKEYRDNQVIKQELSRALDIETKRNFELTLAVMDFVPKHLSTSSEERAEAAFVSLHTDVWNSIVNRGLLHMFEKEGTAGDLVRVYNLIYEMNTLIDWQKNRGTVSIACPAYSRDWDDMKYGQTNEDYHIHNDAGWTDALVKQFRKNVRRQNICVRHGFPFYSKDFEHKKFDKEIMRATKNMKTKREKEKYLKEKGVDYWFPNRITYLE